MYKMQVRIEAVQIAEAFNIKKFRSEFQTEAYSGTTSEIFYALNDNQYLYIFDYGVAGKFKGFLFGFCGYFGIAKAVVNFNQPINNRLIGNRKLLALFQLFNLLGDNI